MAAIYKVAGFGFLVLTSKYAIGVFEILYDIKLRKKWKESEPVRHQEQSLIGHWSTVALLTGSSAITGYLAYWCFRKAA